MDVGRNWVGIAMWFVEQEMVLSIHLILELYARCTHELLKHVVYAAYLFSLFVLIYDGSWRLATNCWFSSLLLWTSMTCAYCVAIVLN